jgi:enoyl-[acyl-carrier protein] reductase I
MGLLDGKKGLVVGIANERSYAFHIAKELTEHGARCAFTHLPGDKHERRTRRAIKELAIDDPWVQPMDAGSDDDMDRVFNDYAASFDRMDFLIHSIAFADRDWLSPGKFVDTPREAFFGALDISSYSLVAMAHRARPLMSKTGGSILAMSYYGAQKVVLGYNIMGVAKACLECSTRYLASELGVDKIRVNTISGGFLRTLAASAVGGAERIGEEAHHRTPLKRNVEGGDVGRTAVYLVSDLSSGVTGENIFVDCGAHVVGF